MTEVPLVDMEKLVLKWRKSTKVIFILAVFFSYLLTTCFKVALSSNLIKEDDSVPSIVELVKNEGYIFEVSVHNFRTNI